DTAPLPVPEVQDRAHRIIGMVHTETPAAQAHAPGIPAADAVVLLLPDRDAFLRSSFRSRDGHPGAEDGKGRCQDPGRAEIGRRVMVTDPYGDGLPALHHAAVAVCAIPGEGGLLVRQWGKALSDPLPRYQDVQINPIQGSGHRCLTQGNDHTIRCLTP